MKRMKLLSLVFSVCLILALLASMLFTACAKKETPSTSPTATVAKTTKNFKLVLDFGAPDKEWTAGQEFAKQLEQKTDGRLTASLHVIDEMGSRLSRWEEMAQGTIEMAVA